MTWEQVETLLNILCATAGDTNMRQLHNAALMKLMSVEADELHFAGEEPEEEHE